MDIVFITGFVWGLGVGGWGLGVGGRALGVGRWALGVGRWGVQGTGNHTFCKTAHSAPAVQTANANAYVYLVQVLGVADHEMTYMS
jgi:hypothetical protein